MRGAAAVIIWNGIEASAATDFIAWHNREHIAERVGIPGFLSGRRLRDVEGSGYLTLYDLENSKTLSSTAYQARLDAPTDWTRRVVPYFRNTVRALSNRTAGAGYGDGGFVLSLRLGEVDPMAAREKALRAHVADVYEDDKRIVGWHWFETDQTASQRKTAESAARKGDADQPLATLLVEASSLTALMRLVAALTEEAGPEAAIGVFQHEITVTRDDVA